MWHAAQPFDLNSSSPDSAELGEKAIAWLDGCVLRRKASRSVILLCGKPRIRDPHPVERRLHLRGVVPHLLRKRNGVRERLPRGHRLNARTKRLPDAVTLRASLLHKNLAAALRVAGLFK